MDNNRRVDAELVAPLQATQRFFDALDLHDIPGTRAMLQRMAAEGKDQLPVIDGVSVEDRLVPGPEGSADVPIRIYQPTARSGILPALIWIHGGSYIFGDVDGDDLLAKHFAKKVDCLVASVEYRLAPEHPFPAPLEDCYAALKWLAAHSDELGVRRSRIAVGGDSAGGGLAAGLALLARDRAEVDVAFQLLIYPSLDDRNTGPASESASGIEASGIPVVWSRERNLIGWRSYLGCEPGGEDVSSYAAPSRATDLTGLPPAYIAVGDLDLFLDEDIELAQRLLACGVPTELHVYPGAFHLFEVFGPAASISQRFITERDQVLKCALHLETRSEGGAIGLGKALP